MRLLSSPPAAARTLRVAPRHGRLPAAWCTKLRSGREKRSRALTLQWHGFSIVRPFEAARATRSTLTVARDIDPARDPHRVLGAPTASGRVAVLQLARIRSLTGSAKPFLRGLGLAYLPVLTRFGGARIRPTCFARPVRQATEPGAVSSAPTVKASLRSNAAL